MFVRGSCAPCCRGFGKLCGTRAPFCTNSRSILHLALGRIERKAGTRFNPNANTDLLTEPEAFELANAISTYPEVTVQTLQTLEPSTIVTYLFGLSHAISSANRILQVKAAAEAGERDLAEARMLLLWAARVTLGNGMRVLGLEPLERM